MPIIIIEGPKIDKDKKSRLVKELTKKASEIFDLPEQTITILIKENNSDNVGIGGNLLSDITSNKSNQ
ncbi:4-oxalocrotonate tautomerase [Anoxybacter fermentans]|uniref:4-oxalocrotonate tautomerase n=1 Tax=Anoxybacter fermentans TaxID=1323375 RepID=A0A3Q9HQ07_9FIRM|nr:4-oxalocrotonate tautomerase DmpI [Anoxybacter fermentans]AZR73099.1 4-oxalocrotonate tautomerase [Anoxybacter fermentans]